MTLCNTKSIVDWLTDGARSALRPDIMLAYLCDRLSKPAAALARVGIRADLASRNHGAPFKGRFRGAPRYQK